ncbi:MAG: hypothetical protein RLZZ610_388 [Actinomycetota bacterium]
MSSQTRYSGRIAALATLHGKEAAISPVFGDELGIQVQLARVDTDEFGTFSGEIPRGLSQLDTAIAKANEAIKQTGQTLAIASEGTVGPDPLVPIISSDLETLVFVDTELGLVIHESYRSNNIKLVRQEFQPGDNLEEFLARADFPNHGLIVKSKPSNDFQAVKGLTDELSLREAINQLSHNGDSVIVESDLRANYCPSRMLNIAECAKLLAKRIASDCPSCQAPGWGRIEPLFGLECGDCGDWVATAVSADRMGCVSCSYVEEKFRPSRSAEPRFCPSCNP